MFDRLQYMTVYVGSAAVAAFLAACLSAPRVATFACASLDVDAAQQCELVETLSAPTAADGDAAPEDSPARSRAPVSAGADEPARAPT